MEELLQVLKSCTSASLDVIKPAQEWLKSHECDATYYVYLSDVCHRNNLESTVRLLAIILLKNGIDKYWRPGMTGSITAESKQQIKHNICLILDEPQQQIAIQCAVIFAKIARFDYPGEWNDLIPFLLSGMLSPKSSVHQSRCILVLKHVLKMLSTKRLPNAKEIFSQVSSKIFHDVFLFWMSYHTSWKDGMLSAKVENAETLNTANNLFLLTSMVRYLAVENYENDVIRNIYEAVLNNLTDTVSLFSLWENSLSTQGKCFKVAISSIKILDSLLSASPNSYTIGAQKVLSSLCNQIHICKLSQQATEHHGEKYIVKCMNVTKSIFEDGQFFDTFMSGTTMEEITIAPHLRTLFQCLISHYLTLSYDDLAYWENDPETFSNDIIGKFWKIHKRSAAEVLALTLIKKFPDILVTTLLSMLGAVQDVAVHNVGQALTTGNPVLQSLFSDCSIPYQYIARKEAVYYMVGLAVYEVLDFINFEEWLVNKLIPEVESVQDDAHGKLLHRRVLWLISQWAEIKPSDELRPVLYGFVVSSLHESLDMAVRLMASSTVQYLLDDFEFDINLFKEHQNTCFEGLHNLLMNTEDCDTKMRILNVFTFLIERLGKTTEPYREKISAIVPLLWDHAVSENHDMLKCSILGTMMQFVNALGNHSLSIRHLTFPLIRESTDLSNASHIYLLEDGLLLWLAAIHNCCERNQDLFGQFGNIFGLLEYSSESLKTCFHIIEAYVLLYRDSLLAEYGARLDEIFLFISTDVRNECLVLISRLVSIMFEVLPQNSILVCSTYCKDAIKHTFHEKDSVLLAANFTLVSHMILTNATQFWQLLNNFSVAASEDFNKITQSFIKTWCDNIDTIIDVDKKKLSALALLTVLSALPEINVLTSNFADIICAVVQILYDVCDEHRVDMLVNEADQDVFETNEQECSHDSRKRLLRQKSVAMNISLPVFASQKLKLLKESLSEQNFMKLISNVNTETVNELQMFLSNY